jgi:hypothetical protein
MTVSTHNQYFETHYRKVYVGETAVHIHDTFVSNAYELLKFTISLEKYMLQNMQFGFSFWTKPVPTTI